MSDEIREGPAGYSSLRDALAAFSALLQRDSTDTTYKYALLRALVDIAEQDHHHVAPHDEHRVRFPLGLIVDRWLRYYYPFVEARLPQRNGERVRRPKALVPDAPSPEAPQRNGERVGQPKSPQLSFREDFEAVTRYYQSRDGYRGFCVDYFSLGAVPADLAPAFARLVRRLRTTITSFPMKHLGYSLTRSHYALVDYRREERVRLPLAPGGELERAIVINGLGTAYLSRRWYETFRALGGLASGTDSLLAQWARFTHTASRHHPVALGTAFDALLLAQDPARRVKEAREVFGKSLSSSGATACVWSGSAIRSPQHLAIDHAIPFAIWGSNALWNLLPALESVNARKSDRIPAPDLILRRGPSIAEAWARLRTHYPAAFDRDFALELTGGEVRPLNPEHTARGLEALAAKCRYLIHERGFPPWQPSPP